VFPTGRTCIRANLQPNLINQNRGFERPNRVFKQLKTLLLERSLADRNPGR